VHEIDLRVVAEGFADEVRNEKEFFCESLKASERLLTDTTQLLRQREEAYNGVTNEKLVLEKHVEELKLKLNEMINSVECTEHKAKIERLEEQVKRLGDQNKELADKVKTYQSRYAIELGLMRKTGGLIDFWAGNSC
jgi:peptidoglycan hydrolase CwlO-like protein